MGTSRKPKQIGLFEGKSSKDAELARIILAKTGAYYGPGSLAWRWAEMVLAR